MRSCRDSFILYLSDFRLSTSLVTYFPNILQNYTVVLATAIFLIFIIIFLFKNFSIGLRNYSFNFRGFRNSCFKVTFNFSKEKFYLNNGK